MKSPMSEEEGAALALLAENHRVMVILIPEDVPDEFAARLTTWSNFILDTKLMPPVALPVVKRGDGLVCPYCGVPASQAPDAHASDCDWREAIVRWAAAQMQIEEEYGGASN